MCVCLVNVEKSLCLGRGGILKGFAVFVTRDVLPAASSQSLGRVAFTLSIPLLICCTQPLNSCPNVRGVASWYKTDIIKVQLDIHALHNALQTACCLNKTVENAAGYLFPYLKVLESVSSLDFDLKLLHKSASYI